MNYKQIVFPGMMIVLFMAILTPVQGQPGGRNVDLLVDQTTDVGNVIITFSSGNTMNVRFTTDMSGWYLTEAHVDVQTILANIPQTGNNNPQVGKFAYHAEFDSPTPEDGSLSGGTTTYEFNIPFTYDENVGFTVYIAAHAEVEQWTYDSNNGVWTTLDETGWGEGNQFNVGRNWSMYIAYTYVPTS